MRWRRIRAILVKETLQILRDPRSLMIALAIPLLQMFMLGYGISLDVKHIPLCAYDREASLASQDFLHRFTASPYFSLQTLAASSKEITADLDAGKCLLAIVIPSDFSKSLHDRGETTVQAIVDATDSNTANIAANYAQAVVSAYSSEVQVKLIEARGARVPTTTPVAVEARVWFNEDLASRNYIVPGIVALVMAIVGAQLTSLTIAREWERGTMELLVSTPVQPMELLLGKMAPYFVIGMMDAVVCLALAVFWFEVPYRGTVLALAFTTALFLIVVLCIGYYLSVAIRSQAGASQVALIVSMLPTILLSGFAFPIDQMPAAVRAVTYLVSGRYYVIIVKALFLKGTDWAQLWAPILCLALYAAVMVWLAARAFKKTLD